MSEATPLPPEPAALVLPPAIDLIRSLRSQVCPVCGYFKKSGISMCHFDYKRLSKSRQLALYDRIGEGYEEAIAEAFKALDAPHFILPPA